MSLCPVHVASSQSHTTVSTIFISLETLTPVVEQRVVDSYVSDVFEMEKWNLAAAIRSEREG